MKWIPNHHADSDPLLQFQILICKRNKQKDEKLKQRKNQDIKTYRTLEKKKNFYVSPSPENKKSKRKRKSKTQQEKRPTPGPIIDSIPIISHPAIAAKNSTQRTISSCLGLPHLAPIQMLSPFGNGLRSTVSSTMVARTIISLN